MTMNDVFMRGLIEKDQTFLVTMNWYACHKIEKGEVVLYRFSMGAEPVVKRVVAAEGDRIHLVNDTKSKHWRLEVNEQPVLSVDGQPYFFGVSSAKPNLKTYEEAHKGILQEGTVVVLSAFPPGNADSGVFGVVSVNDIVGKVELKK